MSMCTRESDKVTSKAWADALTLKFSVKAYDFNA